MSDQQESEELWGVSSTAETVGTAETSFVKTHQTIIVSSLVLLILSGAAVTLLLQGLQKPATVAKEATPAKNISSAQSNIVEIVEKTSEIFPAITSGELWESKEKAAVNRAAIISLQNQTKTLSSNYESLVKLEASLKAQLDLLQNSQQGARLTSQPELVAQYVGVSEEFEEITRYDLGVESFLNSMNDLFTSVLEENAASVFRPQTETIDLARQFDKSVLERKKNLTELSKGLESLLDEAQENKPGITLAVAISNAEKERVIARTKRRADFSKQARAESWEKIKSKITEAEDDFVDSETKLKTAELAAKAALNRQRVSELAGAAERAKADSIARAAKQKLENEFAAASGEIQTYLQYLMADGRDKRGSATGVGPVSYGAVVGSGALNEGNQGLIEMSKWCGSNMGWNETNSRAKDSNTLVLVKFMFAQPKYESHIRFAEKAQQLLKKFGPLMVEKGLLAK